MNTIKSSEEISTLFSLGYRIQTPYLTFIVRKRDCDKASTKSGHDHDGRVAFIAGKKLGGAVWRNKAKRRLRALCKDLGGPWDEKDIVFLAKSRLLSVSYSKVLFTCKDALDHSDMFGNGDSEINS